MYSVAGEVTMTALAAEDRIVLDTNIVRGLIESRPGCLHIPKLLKLKGSHPVSIAHGAIGELLWWLRTRDQHFLERVKPALQRLDPLLDNEFPIIVGGSERLAMAGLIPWPVRSRADESIVQQTTWRHIRRVRSRHSLTKKRITFRDTKGRAITMEPEPPDPKLKDSEDEWWSDVITAPAGLVITKEVERRIAEERRNHAARKLGISPNTPGLERIDLFNEFIARHQRRASSSNFVPPQGARSNDWFDADLLVYAVLPAVICTEDLRFIRSVREVNHEDRIRVMSPSELYDWLESGRVPF